MIRSQSFASDLWLGLCQLACSFLLPGLGVEAFEKQIKRPLTIAAVDNAMVSVGLRTSGAL
jgi:hypothetical protein